MRTFGEYLRRFRPSKHRETLTASERFREDADRIMDEHYAWTVPPEHRPSCPLSGEPCRSWTCLVDVCEDPAGEQP